jgi:two-component system chemotaxis sensor kinase CheA
MTEDPYRYFRIEARELRDGIGKSVLELERSPADVAVIGRILRLAHTLKGAARVVKLTELAERAHAIESELAAHRSGELGVSREQITRILRLVDDVAARIASLDRPPTEAAPHVRPAAPEVFETIRIEVEQMDQLLESVTEAAVQVTDLEREAGALEQARRLVTILAEQTRPRRADGAVTDGLVAAQHAHATAIELREQLTRIERRVSTGVEQVRAELSQVRAATNRLRLLPATVLFASLDRAARDAAESLERKVEFRTSGGETRLDAHVLTALQTALLHVVRNAVAHGIEPEAERLAVGKPAAGRIEVTVERRGSRAAFTCTDDGRGIDVPALGRAALLRGLVRESELSALTQESIVTLLLRGGLTTSAKVTPISGRGIGLDVVREVADRLKGGVELKSEPGRGTRFVITVPVSLSSVPALLVDDAGVVASIPLEAVRRTLRLLDTDVARSGDSESILYEGKVIPFVPLSTALGRQRAQPRRRGAWPAVVVSAGEAIAAVGVDALLGTAEVVMRSLPARADAEPVVAGASLDAEGTPQLVLDPPGLVAAARLRRRVAAAPPRRQPVLVVDDSLTTRMLEQSILESAGYEVELATSAEEALAMAERRSYGLFIVDVEMPGMNGFEFVEKTRKDPALGKVPAILVTSRGSPEDKQRGRNAGARAYIVKGEFDQGLLLQTIQNLLG